MSKVQVDTIDTRSGTSTMQIGSTNTSTINIGVSGDTVNIPSGVTIANAGTATGFGGTNTPAFFAHASGSQTGLSDNTYTKVTLATEVYDTDSAFTDSRFTVPSGKAGKYIIYGSVRPEADSNSDLRNSYLAFYLNGSQYSENRMNYQSNLIRGATNSATLSIDLSVGDYVELYGATDTDGSARSFVGGSSYRSTFMGGYRLIE